MAQREDLPPNFGYARQGKPAVQLPDVETKKTNASAGADRILAVESEQTNYGTAESRVRLREGQKGDALKATVIEQYLYLKRRYEEGKSTVDETAEMFGLAKRYKDIISQIEGE